MTRSREQITAALLAELAEKTKTVQGNAQALKALLIEELMLQQEADWAMLGYDDEQSKISHALRHLDAASEFETTDDSHFYEKWKVTPEEASYWRAFVTGFAELMRDNSGYKVSVTYKEKFGLVHASTVAPGEPPSDHRIFSGEVEDKQAAHTQRLEKKKQQKKALAEFGKEVNCWNELNLHRLFAEYLIALPEDADIREQSINIINHVIPSLVDEIINPVCSKQGRAGINRIELAQEFNDTRQKIEALRSGLQPSKEAGYEWVVQIVREYKEESARMCEMPLDEEPNAELFKQYVTQLQSISHMLHQAIEHEKNEVKKISLSGAVKYALVGSGVSLFVGGAIVAGLLAGTVLVSMPAILAACFVLALFVAATSAISYCVKKLYDESRSSSMQEQVVENKESPVSSFLQTCSTSICAIVLGMTSCGSIAAPDLQDQLDPVAPISALDLEDDKDATEKPSDSSGTRAGPSSSR